MKVLVVEDDPKMAALVRRGLTANGNATDIAPDGEEALWMARAHAYDAIVLDVMLPGGTASRPVPLCAKQVSGRRC